MYKTSNLNLAALLILINKAKVISLIANGNKRKVFVLNGDEKDFQETIQRFFNREKMLIAPFDLFITTKQLKGFLYDKEMD